MIKPFNMDAFLSGVPTGSHAIRERHLRQAMVTQAAIAARCQKETPWGWQREHLDWFLKNKLKHRGKHTKYYYLLTIRLIVRRL
jgi:hypothetical protein